MSKTINTICDNCGKTQTIIQRSELIGWFLVGWQDDDGENVPGMFIFDRTKASSRDFKTASRFQGAVWHDACCAKCALVMIGERLEAQ